MTMQALVVATKAQGADSVRQASRRDHLRYMLAHRDSVTFGGSFEADDGTWGGMVLIIEAASLVDAENWLRLEPYCQAGLFETITLRPFRQLLPEPTVGLLQEELAAELRRN